jgi:hypothetical protein
MRRLRFRGLIPERKAAFLPLLSTQERREVFAVRGTFREVRALIGAARLLDRYLRAAPRAAARGRTSFGEFHESKRELIRDISALREKLNRFAESVWLILPRVPRIRKEEAGPGGTPVDPGS